MSLLQFIVIVSAVVFLLFGIDLYKRKKMNILHFIIFFFWWWAIILFALDNSLLNKFWEVFWLARWADLLVYISLILLFYFYINLLNNHTKDKSNLTRLISQNTINETHQKYFEKIHNYKNSDYKDNFIFNIRAYNEWKVLGWVIDEIIKEWFNKILIVNDWSTDNTIELVTDKQNQYPDKLILLASHIINRWWWAANQTWYNFIKKYWEELKIKRFVWYDADWQMDIQDTKTFIKRIKENEENQKKIDLYLWSRFVSWASYENMTKSRKIIIKISKLVTKIFYGTKVSDPHSWFRMISLESLRKINITADWMHYANELNEQIKSQKMKFEEVPIHIRYTEYSMYDTSKWHRNKNSDSIKLAVEMIYKKIFFR